VDDERVGVRLLDGYRIGIIGASLA
jgi:hypothetical protein